MPRVALGKFSCHAWHQFSFSCATRGPPAWFSYHTWANAARSAPRPVYVPRVACTPPAPPPARLTCHAWTHSARAAPWLCMCHTWHERRTAPPLPAHVPRVASLGTHCPCQGICHTWHARLTRRPFRRTCHAWHVRPTLRRVAGASAARGTYAARSAWRMCRAWHVRRALRLAHVSHFLYHAWHDPN